MTTNVKRPKSRIRVFFQHLLGWLIYILYEEAVVYFSKIDISTVFAFIVNAIIFYNTWKILRAISKKITNVFFLAPVLFVVSTAIIVITVLFKLEVDALMYHTSFQVSADPDKISSLIMRTIYFGGMGAAFGFARELIQREREVAQHSIEKAQILEQQQKLEKKALQAELNVIKSQINPHFVFNTLGFLYAETYKKLPEVGQSIITLSNIMRHALTKNEDGFSSLESELAYIKDFIKIHENRSKAFFMKISIESGVIPYKVVSLVLITLIENMFKHGIFNQSTKEAALSITVENGKLHFYSLNYKNNNSVNKIQSNGIGLNYIRERLTDEYGREGYELLINETHNSYECKLTMPLKYHESN
ncbi:sensor histidine kinase [Mucilaginibacter sp. cycad4]|uniref:sensor histidine kinase n=1 Tax=Mucilaginibacter sp. cycad4 TaxID=3342096 RepID=UPI002AAAA22E|nr:sensor histidine kinase [Mucilaginibacter gossypii]WPU97239.1 sensor histidine kinase [Mucilaginibacter gossypii]